MSIKKYYPCGECPNCECIIPKTTKAGEKCTFCGYILKMPETFKKVTIGRVVQIYKTLSNGIHICKSQKFIAETDEEVKYETAEYGDKIEIDKSKEVDCSFEMTQPMHVPDK